jgi:hypothetical protein
MGKNKLPNIIVILILTLVTVVTWISFSIYRALTEETSPSVPQNISEPIDPKLDVVTINKIKSGLFLNQ